MSNATVYKYPPRRGQHYAPTAGRPSGLQTSARPIRVTEDALESLVYCLVHSVEFQRSLAQGCTVVPEDVTSLALGGVCYAAQKQHCDSIVRGIPPVVEQAKSLRASGTTPPASTEPLRSVSPFAGGGGGGVSFTLLLRVYKISHHSGFFWDRKAKVLIEEWQFAITKVEGEGIQREKNTTGPTGAAYSEAFQPPHPTAASGLDSGVSPSNLDSMGVLQFADDPAQIREVLQYILSKSFEAIDTFIAKDFALATEVVYEILLAEKPR